MMKFRSAHKGQGSLIAMAVITLVAMVSMGVSLSASSLYNTRRTLSTQGSMQLYYVAQAGIQEAIATRFIPKSNYLNYLRYAGVTNNNSPYYGLSGKVYQNPADLSSGLVGHYRYIVLGGDQAANRATGLLDAARYGISFNQPPDQPIYVVSKGTVCAGTGNNTFVDALSVGGGSNRPNTCSSGIVEELTIVAEIDLRRAGAVAEDVVTEYRVYKSSPTTTDNPTIPISLPVFVPGQGIQNSLNFETAWANSPLPQQSVKPVQVVFYDAFTGNVNGQATINGASTNIPGTVDPRSNIKIFFNGGIDVRTTLIDPRANEDPVADCFSNTSNCTIRVYDKTNSQYYANMDQIAVSPEGQTYVMLLPPLASASLVPGSGIDYRIEIDTALADWHGNHLPNEYRINFTTN